jgi:hypothetical protein
MPKAGHFEISKTMPTPATVKSGVNAGRCLENGVGALPEPTVVVYTGSRIHFLTVS